MDKVTREQVLLVFKGADREMTTREVAEALGAREYSVRAAVSWLVIGGHLRLASIVCRCTRNGHPYIASAYGWTGKVGPVQRVRRDPDERQIMDGLDCTALVLAVAKFRR